MFRDPREVVISEHRMRIEVYLERKTSELDPFIYERFEVNAGRKTGGAIYKRLLLSDPPCISSQPSSPEWSSK